MSILLVSAVDFEVTNASKILKNKKIPFESFHCGIGPINAARSVDKLSQIANGKDVIFIGTCGSFDRFNQVSLVTTREVEWLPTCQRNNLSWAIEGINPPIYLSKNNALVDSLPEKKVICCPNISKNNELPSNYIDSDYVENLELYSIAESLIKNSKSVNCILGITNFIGPNARTEWKQNFKNASLLTAKFIEENLL